MAAALSAIAHSRCQAAWLSGWPLASASTAAMNPSSATKALIVGRQLAADAGRESVADQLAFQQQRDLRRHRSLSWNQGKAQLATSCPAASAIT